MLHFVSLLLATLLPTGFALQTANGLRPVSADTAPGVAAPAPKPVLSPEVRGDIFMARKMYRDAIEAYMTGPAKSAMLANKIGIAYHQLLDLRNARKYYETASRLQPEYWEAVNNLGTVFYAQKSYRRAIEQYRKAMRINPQSASIYSNLGTAYFARKKYEDAQQMYQQALALDPEVFEHRGTQGTVLQEHSVEERAKFHYYLARTYAKAGEVERALLYIRKALEEGFKERQKFFDDPEFQALREVPEFKQLMATEQKVL